MRNKEKSVAIIKICDEAASFIEALLSNSESKIEVQRTEDGPRTALWIKPPQTRSEYHEGFDNDGKTSNAI